MAEGDDPEVLDEDLISQTTFEEVYGQGPGALPPAGRELPRMPWEKRVAAPRELPRLTPEPTAPDAGPLAETDSAPHAARSAAASSALPKAVLPEAASLPQHPKPPALAPASEVPPSAQSSAPHLDLVNTVSGSSLFHTRSMRPLAALDEVRQALDRAGDHQQVGWVLARHALSKARRVVLLVRRGPPWVGWTGAGEGVDPERVASVIIPPVEGTIFGLVMKTGGHYLGPLAKNSVHDRFLRTVGIEPPASLGLFPIQYDGRVSIALYLDGGAGGHLSTDIAEILVIAQQVPRVLARLAQANANA